MQNEINIQLDKESNELVLREGVAEAVVPFREKFTVKGDISTPRVYLENPPKWFTGSASGDEPVNTSFIKVSRDDCSISLYVDKGMPWQETYTGQLEIDELIKKFKINTGESFTTFQLADLIKMNRSYFDSKDIAMKLVSELRSFKAKVDSDLENMDDARGNRRVLIAQIVDSNIPDSFVLNLPIFKGTEKTSFEVEINIKADDFSCVLISPQMNDFINDTKNNLIDAELELIKKLHPVLKIFQI